MAAARCSATDGAVRRDRQTQAGAAELIAAGPPFDPAEAGFDRHTVYLTESEVVFVFEDPGAEYGVQDLLDDPVRSAALSS